MLEIESLLHAVVHENINLRVRHEGLEVNNEMQNIPVAVADENVIPPEYHHASSSALNHAKPPVRSMPTI